MSTKRQLPMKDAFKIFTVLLMAVLVSACSQKITFPTSSVLPAADAVLKIDEDKAGNYELELEVENMAKADRLTPPRRTYVVWMNSANHGVMNLGSLRISGKNKGSLTTVTPYKPTRVFITAEDTQSVISPSTQVVLSTDDFKVK